MSLLNLQGIGMNKLQKRQVGLVKDLFYRTLVVLSLFSFGVCLEKAKAQEQKLKDVQKAQMKVDEAARDSQKRVKKTAEQTRSLLDHYRTTLREIENTRVYNDQLRKLIASQEEEMVSTKEQIESVKKTSKSIYPFMLKMIKGLEEFIKLDVPFLMEERDRRLSQIKSLMEKAKVSASEKFRRLIEAYQVENEYGRTIEAYRGPQEVNGKKLTVDFLRAGRISLVYQTLDSKNFGYWDQKERTWKKLSGSYRKSIQQGLRMARKQAAPNLITLPVPAPEEVKLEVF